MKLKSILGILVCATFLGGVSSFIPAARGQDLKAELDALDNLPEDDLSAGNSDSGASTSVDPAASAPPVLPPAGVPDAGALSNNSAASNSPAVKNSTPPKELGVGDLDLQGLDQEIHFDSFKDGGKIGLDQLRGSSQKGNGLGEEIKGKITGLDFKQLQDRIRLVVTADRPVDWTRELRSKRRQVIVEMRNMDIAREVLKRALDTGEFEGPVALVQAFPAKVGGRDSVKILFQLRSFVDPTILRTGNDLVIDFPLTGGDTLFKSKTASRVIVPKTYLSADDLKEFKGSPISINVKGAELGDFLNLISRSAGKNFVVSGTIGSEKKITMNLTNVPWDQALSIALFNNSLGYQALDGVIRVASVDQLQKEMDVAREAARKSKDLIPVETRLISVNYAETANVITNVTPFLTKERGHVTLDKRTSQIVVTDIPEVLEKVDRYVRAVDKQTPQVLIEARIVEATETFDRARTFGWNAGGDPSSGGVTAGQFNVGGTAPTPFANGLKLRFASLGGINLVDTFLAFNETQKNSRTVSSPRITVLANETATISQGSKISVTRSDASGNTIQQEVNIPTSLNVTPQVSADGFVVLDVTINRDILIDPVKGSIDTRSAKTKMVVESGKTAVIGGIYQNDIVDTESGIPFLRQIPIFGNLFTSQKSRTKKANELLIFISPRIINQDISRLQTSANLSDGDFSSTPAASADLR